MNTAVEKKYIAKAFVSCSLREEDKQFIKHIENILEAHYIKPVGTVGKFSASPESPAQLMKKNIPEADFVVIVATPRYIQQDLQTGEVTYGLSEMIHVETGIAYAYDKPVVVFVKEGTNIGNFVPNITQYVVLNGGYDDFYAKRPIIYSLLKNTQKIVMEIRSNKSAKSFGKFLL